MKFKLQIIALSMATLFSACSMNNTRMINSWTNPDLKVQPIHFNKIIVVAVAPSDTERRSAEDAMVAKIGPKATPSYTLLNESELKDPTIAKQRIQQASFDGMVLLRWLSVREEKEYTATPTQSPLWDHYSYSWTYMQETNVVQWKILQLETRIFSLADEKLIWSGTTETVEPPAIPQLVNNVAKVIEKKLRSQGLLSPAKNKKGEAQ